MGAGDDVAAMTSLDKFRELHSMGYDKEMKAFFKELLAPPGTESFFYKVFVNGSPVVLYVAPSGFNHEQHNYFSVEVRRLSRVGLDHAL